jgi:crossover junction endodeoxyribonuclease RusA
MKIVYPSISVPYPPSTNRLWSYSSRGVYRTKSYTDWLDLALHSIEWKRELIEKRCAVAIRANPGDRRKRDIDNIVKPLLDLLEHAKIIKNDNLFVELEVKWDETLPPKLAQILITGIASCAREPDRFIESAESCR